MKSPTARLVTLERITVHIVNSLASHFKQNKILVIPLIAMCFLVARNPFSESTLMADLNPYPDAFHYINPAFSLLRGFGVVIEREGRTMIPSVPPLYSLMLAPIYRVIPDARAFYVSNVILLLISFWLLALILKKTFKTQIIQFTVLWLFATNPILTWYVTMPMAEHLILPLYLAGILLLISKVTKTRTIAAAIIAISFFATKYASLPLLLVYPLLYFSKLIWEMERNKTKFHNLLYFCLFLLATAILYLSYEFWFQDYNVIGFVARIFTLIFSRTLVASSAPDTLQLFSIKYFISNLNDYYGWLIGKNLNITWYPTQILPSFLAIPALLGLFLGFLDKRSRSLATNLLTLLLSNLFLMAFFFALDGRYLYIAIPTLMIGFGLTLEWLQTQLPVKGLFLKFETLVMTLITIYLITSFSGWKAQISENFYPTGVPWNYLVVKQMSQFITQQTTGAAQESVVISSISPFLFDFYSHSSMIILPLSLRQQFVINPEFDSGHYDFSNLSQLYQRLIDEGHSVYVIYGLDREQYLRSDFETISRDFILEKKAEGCFSHCVIYQLITKPVSAKPLG